MGDRVIGVAVGGAKLHRDAAVSIGGEDEQQLLQIGAMIFGISVSNRRYTTPGSMRSLIAVLPAEGDGGAVVV